MGDDENIAYWLDIAEYDFESAKVMLTGRRFLYVGFMCHQAVEKTLKSLYIKTKSETPPFVHNLKRLSEECGVYDVFSEEQKDFIDELIPLNIEARYPTYKEKLLKSLSVEKCEVLIKQTEDLCNWIKQLL